MEPNLLLNPLSQYMHIIHHNILYYRIFSTFTIHLAVLVVRLGPGFHHQTPMAALGGRLGLVYQS